MKKHSRHQPMVLAVAPSSGWFGYAVFEGPLSLVDWGLRYVRTDKNKVTAAKVDDLIAQYAPDILVIEDPDGVGSRRGKRVRLLLRALGRRAKKRRLKTRRYSRGRIRECFAPFRAKNKFQIAKRLTAWLPELELSLPAEPRKPWESEHPKMAVFDAAALTVTYFNDADPDFLRGADASR